MVSLIFGVGGADIGQNLSPKPKRVVVPKLEQKNFFFQKNKKIKRRLTYLEKILRTSHLTKIFFFPPIKRENITTYIRIQV